MLESISQFALNLLGFDAFIDPQGLTRLLLRLGIDMATTAIVIRYVYVRLYRWNEHVFTYFAFNLITFSLCFLLRKVPIELGFALGLFAVFGVLRYRTEAIRIRDLTYLFVVIGIAILNAVANNKVSFAELMAINGAIIAGTYAFEYRRRRHHVERKTVVYDKLALLSPGYEDEFAEDIYERTGLVIQRFDIDHVDLLRDTAQITVYCQSGPVPGEPRSL